MAKAKVNVTAPQGAPIASVRELQMAQAKFNVTVQQRAPIAPARELLEQEVTINRLALNLKRRKERLIQELGG